MKARRVLFISDVFKKEKKAANETEIVSGFFPKTGWMGGFQLYVLVAFGKGGDNSHKISSWRKCSYLSSFPYYIYFLTMYLISYDMNIFISVKIYCINDVFMTNVFGVMAE